jgi:hypothetical protein
VHVEHRITDGGCRTSIASVVIEAVAALVAGRSRRRTSFARHGPRPRGARRVGARPVRPSRPRHHARRSAPSSHTRRGLSRSVTNTAPEMWALRWRRSHGARAAKLSRSPDRNGSRQERRSRSFVAGLHCDQPVDAVALATGRALVAARWRRLVTTRTAPSFRTPEASVRDRASGRGAHGPVRCAGSFAPERRGGSRMDLPRNGSDFTPLAAANPFTLVWPGEQAPASRRSAYPCARDGAAAPRARRADVRTGRARIAELVARLAAHLRWRRRDALRERDDEEPRSPRSATRNATTRPPPPASWARRMRLPRSRSSPDARRRRWHRTAPDRRRSGASTHPEVLRSVHTPSTS